MTRRPGIQVLTAVPGVLTAAAALPLLPTAAAAAVTPAAYGMTFMAGPAAVTAHIRAVVRYVDWTATSAAYTIRFAAGRTAGPWPAGVLAEHTTTAAPLAWTALPSAGAATLVTVPAKHEPRTTAPLGTVADESLRPGTGVPFPAKHHGRRGPYDNEPSGFAAAVARG